jgi:hypothetical protein
MDTSTVKRVNSGKVTGKNRGSSRAAPAAVRGIPTRSGKTGSVYPMHPRSSPDPERRSVVKTPRAASKADGSARS